MQNIEIKNGVVTIDGVIYQPIFYDPTVQTVGELIRKTRESKNLSTAQLAEKSGCTKQHISRIEQNENKPTLKIAKRICNALALDIRQLAILAE